MRTSCGTPYFRSTSRARDMGVWTSLCSIARIARTASPDLLVTIQLQIPGPAGPHSASDRWLPPWPPPPTSTAHSSNLCLIRLWGDTTVLRGRGNMRTTPDKHGSGSDIHQAQFTGSPLNRCHKCSQVLLIQLESAE